MSDARARLRGHARDRPRRRNTVRGLTRTVSHNLELVATLIFLELETSL